MKIEKSCDTCYFSEIPPFLVCPCWEYCFKYNYEYYEPDFLTKIKIKLNKILKK